MTLAELKTKLATTGIPVSYSSLPIDQATAKPYICYYQDSINPFAADGIVYYSTKVIIVRLYTEKRNELTEGLVETALTGIFYTKSISYLDDQKIYEITYQIEV